MMQILPFKQNVGSLENDAQSTFHKKSNIWFEMLFEDIQDDNQGVLLGYLNIKILSILNHHVTVVASQSFSSICLGHTTA